jgi:hypothetical protein
MVTPPRTQVGKQSFADALKQQKWLTLIGLPILLTTSLTGIYGLWGLLFVYWGLVSLRSGEVYLLEPIERRHDPVLFWTIVMMWIGFGLLYMVADFAPSVMY